MSVHLKINSVSETAIAESWAGEVKQLQLSGKGAKLSKMDLKF